MRDVARIKQVTSKKTKMLTLSGVNVDASRVLFDGFTAIGMMWMSTVEYQTVY
jgi:hypothetical protein